MSTDRTVPFDAARVDGDLARVRANAPAWQSSLRHELGRIRSSRRRVIARLDTIRRLTPPQDPGTAGTWDRYVDLQVASEAGDAVVASIGENLEQAQSLLDDSARTPWTRRMFRAGGIYETVLGSLHRARESLFLVEEDAWVRAQLPTLRANVATSMGPDDPRTEGYLRYLDDLNRTLPPIRTDSVVTMPSHVGRAIGVPSPSGPASSAPNGPAGAGVGPGVLQVITGTTQPAAPAPATADPPIWQGHPPAASVDLLMREQLRGIQTAVDDARMASQIAVRVYRNALVVAILVLAVAALAFPGLATLITARATADATAGSTSGVSLAAIELWGTLGSAVAVIAGLWRLRSSRQPSGLQLAQLALKIPAGALTALFGVLLLQGEIVVQLQNVKDAQIPAYAILFGFAQEGLTRFVDGKAGELLDNAKPLSERTN